MVDHVRRSFSEILQELTWLEDSTKKVAQEKVCTPTRLLLVLFCDADAADVTVSNLYRRRHHRHRRCHHNNRSPCHWHINVLFADSTNLCTARLGSA